MKKSEVACHEKKKNLFFCKFFGSFVYNFKIKEDQTQNELNFLWIFVMIKLCISNGIHTKLYEYLDDRESKDKKICVPVNFCIEMIT